MSDRLSSRRSSGYNRVAPVSDTVADNMSSNRPFTHEDFKKK